MDFNQVETKGQAIEWIHGLVVFGMKPGLERMEWMLDKLDHPEQKSKFLHVAGTNGKGSTVSYISQVLINAGYQVGIFTSPYLVEFTNRIQVNGEDISGEDLVNILNQIIPLVKELEDSKIGIPTEFEVVTTIALLYYATIKQPDIVLWETGLGGRLDSTNIVTPLLSIITNIGHDHMDILGNNIKDIAKEKAGIIKQNIPVISGVEDAEALSVIRELAELKNSELYQLNEQYNFRIHDMSQAGSKFTFNSENLIIEDITIRMIGSHQINNAAISIMALQLLKDKYNFDIDLNVIYQGLEKTFWAGRFEIIALKPLIIIDGAHNLEGVQTIRQTLSLFKYNRLILVLGILKDKALKEYLEIITPLADQIIITEPGVPRKANAEDVRAIVYTIDANKKVITIKEWQQALTEGLKIIEEDDLLLVTGSLYLIAEARRFLLDKKN